MAGLSGLKVPNGTSSAQLEGLQRFAFYLRPCITLTGEAVVVKQPRSLARVVQIKRKAL